MKALKDASAYDHYKIPKLYSYKKFCVSEALHHKIIDRRPKYDRKDDNIPLSVKHAKAKYYTKDLQNLPSWRLKYSRKSWMYDK